MGCDDGAAADRWESNSGRSVEDSDYRGTARRDFDPSAATPPAVRPTRRAHPGRCSRSDVRRTEFWSRADSSSIDEWKTTTTSMSDYIWDEVIGRLPDPSVPANPRTRLIYDETEVPGLRSDARCLARRLRLRHSARTRRILKPASDGRSSSASTAWRAAPAEVADPKSIRLLPSLRRPPRGRRIHYLLSAESLHRPGSLPPDPAQSHPLKLSLFSFILGQHQRILEWLGELPFVDRKRIGFYGLSYGGKTAMRVPPLLDGYAFRSARPTSTSGSGRPPASTRNTATCSRTSTTCSNSISPTSSTTRTWRA